MIGTKTVEKNVFLNNLGLFFSAREKILNNLKNKLFPIKNLEKTSTRELAPELAPGPTKHKLSNIKLQQEFMNEIIVDKKGINDEMFWNYFKYQNPFF